MSGAHRLGRTGRFRRVTVATILAGLAVPAPVVAQGVVPLDSATVAALAALRRRIDGAARLRLEGAWGASVLLAPRLLPAGLGYRSGEGDVPDLRSRVFQLQEVENQTVTGAVLGAGTGLLAVTLLARSFQGPAPVDDSYYPPRTGTRDLSAARLAGLAAGGLLGATLGSRIPRWRTIYRHRVERGGELLLDSAAVIALAPFRSRIDGADSVRVTTAAGTTVLAAPRLLPSGLAYRAFRGVEPPPVPEDLVVQVRGRATGTGAKIGAAVLGLTGVALGVFAAGFACIDAERGCDPPFLEAGAVVGLVGAGAGTLAGALVGTLLPTWRTVYRHEVAFP